MESAGDAADVIPTLLLSSWMPFGKAADEGCPTVTVAVEFEGSLIRLQSQHIATPAALRMGAPIKLRQPPFLTFFELSHELSGRNNFRVAKIWVANI